MLETKKLTAFDSLHECWKYVNKIPGNRRISIIQKLEKYYVVPETDLLGQDETLIYVGTAYGFFMAFHPKSNEERRIEIHTHVTTSSKEKIDAVIKHHKEVFQDVVNLKIKEAAAGYWYTIGFINDMALWHFLVNCGNKGLTYPF